ncbi:MAG: S-layer homology domain-containing protein [Thermoleophilia bacterium]|nr:S-layer homology domain-containing protein [Thermoleophilia bacterium]
MEAADQAGLLSWRGGAGDDPVTRLEVAQTAARLGESRLATPPPDYTLPFEDIPASAREDLALLAFHEIVSGNGASSFSPEAFATRGQTAKIIALTLDPSVPPRYAPVLDRARENRAGEQAPDVTFSPKIWSPAETLTSSLEQSFTEALRRAHLVALFPSTPPPLEGQATGQFGIDQKFGGSPEALVVVRLPNVNPVVGVFSRAAGGQSLADAFPGDRGEPVKVRGQDGLWAPLSPHGTVVVWSEFGYHFLAESDGLELAPLLRWLDSWRPIPAPTNE